MSKSYRRRAAVLITLFVTIIIAVALWYWSFTRIQSELSKLEEHGKEFGEPLLSNEFFAILSANLTCIGQPEMYTYEMGQVEEVDCWDIYNLRWITIKKLVNWWLAIGHANGSAYIPDVYSPMTGGFLGDWCWNITEVDGKRVVVIYVPVNCTLSIGAKGKPNVNAKVGDEFWIRINFRVLNGSLQSMYVWTPSFSAMEGESIPVIYFFLGPEEIRGKAKHRGFNYYFMPIFNTNDWFTLTVKYLDLFPSGIDVVKYLNRSIENADIRISTPAQDILLPKEMWYAAEPLTIAFSTDGLMAFKPSAILEVTVRNNNSRPIKWINICVGGESTYVFMREPIRRGEVRTVRAAFTQKLNPNECYNATITAIYEDMTEKSTVITVQSREK
ncbi:MAG: hypothetical protein QXQ50_08845 [Candidatus Bathyarchaeia archaeon]